MREVAPSNVKLMTLPVTCRQADMLASALDYRWNELSGRSSGKRHISGGRPVLEVLDSLLRRVQEALDVTDDDADVQLVLSLADRAAIIDACDMADAAACAETTDFDVTVFQMETFLQEMGVYVRAANKCCRQYTIRDAANVLRERDVAFRREVERISAKKNRVSELTKTPVSPPTDAELKRLGVRPGGPASASRKILHLPRQDKLLASLEALAPTESGSKFDSARVAWNELFRARAATRRGVRV